MSAKISAIFCSYNRYDLLEDAVASIFASKGFDGRDCEVVIVDNTPLSARQQINIGGPIRIIFCDEPGLSNARNAGIAGTKSPLIAFLDDDAIIHDGWLPAVLDGFDRHPEALICGGKTLPFIEQEHRPTWWNDHLATYLSCIDWGNEVRSLAVGMWVVGANIAYRREVFEKYGLFDPALGRRGHATLLSNDETAIMRKVGLDATYYLPEMFVDHVIPHERLEQSWFRKRVAWQAISDLLSGESYLTVPHAWDIFKTFVAASPAEFRSIQALYYDVADPEIFERQLNALYAFGILFGDGMPSGSVS